MITMRAIYLTWGETPRTSGVYGSQVIRQLKAIKQKMPSSEFVLVSGLPIIFSGLIKEKFSYISELNKISQILADIPHKIIPIWSPQNFFYCRSQEFQFFHFIADYHLSLFIKHFCPDIIHCRSYHATYAAIMARKYSKQDYKIIFDPRSLWIEECLLKDKIKIEDKDYMELKKIENDLLNEVDVTVAVSDTMRQHYESLGVENCRTIYLSAPVEELKSSKKNIFDKVNNKKIKLCYVGSLANNTWHQPKVLFDAYQNYRKYVENPSLLIITKSNHRLILKEKGEIPLEEIEIVSTSNAKELGNYLQGCSIGILPYFVPTSTYEILVANTVIASKTAEYLAAGLPVLVNKYCGGAATLINRFKVGISYDPVTFQEINQENIENLLNPQISSEAINIAEDLFCYDKNAQRYKELLLSLN